MKDEAKDMYSLYLFFSCITWIHVHSPLLNHWPHGSWLGLSPSLDEIGGIESLGTDDNVPTTCTVQIWGLKKDLISQLIHFSQSIIPRDDAVDLSFMCRRSNFFLVRKQREGFFQLIISSTSRYIFLISSCKQLRYVEIEEYIEAHYLLRSARGCTGGFPVIRKMEE